MAILKLKTHLPEEELKNKLVVEKTANLNVNHKVCINSVSIFMF